jgi:acyl carrier protein
MDEKQFVEYAEELVSSITSDFINLEANTILDTHFLTELYGLNSIEFMEFISLLEDELNFTFPVDATYDELNSLRYIYNFLISETIIVTS